MKSYRVTKDNPMFKEGLIFDEATYTEEIRASTEIGKWYIPNSAIKDYIKKGWLEEVEEKEFTKSVMKNKMIDFLEWYIHESKTHYVNLEKYFAEYQKANNEKS